MCLRRFFYICKFIFIYLVLTNTDLTINECNLSFENKIFLKTSDKYLDTPLKYLASLERLMHMLMVIKLERFSLKSLLVDNYIRSIILFSLHVLYICLALSLSLSLSFSLSITCTTSRE
jgi:hypothetical protein